MPQSSGLPLRTRRRYRGEDAEVFKPLQSLAVKPNLYMQNYPLGIHEQRSSGMFGALFFCVLAKALRRWEVWRAFLLGGQGTHAPATALARGTASCCANPGANFQPFEGRRRRGQEVPKQSFAPDANAAARYFLHLCIRKFPEEDFSVSPKCQSQPGLI